MVINHRARVIMSGTSDHETLNYVANLLDDEEIRQVISTYVQGGESSTTEMAGYRRVTPADVLHQIKPG